MSRDHSTRLIEDSPALEDAFAADGDIGPHQRVADALFDMVVSDPGGKMVGLEGGWGAGKSTVVALLSEHLDEHEDFHIAVFDAWAHEGDPLRRTYLESLVHQLKKKHWVDEAKWNHNLELLANRRRVEQTKTVPKPTPLGKLVGIATLLVPFGIALVPSALDKGVSWTEIKPGTIPFLIGTLLSVSPLLVVLCNWLAIKTRRFFRRAVSETASALILSDAITEVTTETVETPNPTSIEFEQYFRDLMAEALEGNQRRLCLVLDNLDRVDADVALQIWSTLQTFLHGLSCQKKEWFDRLWVLVPYDPQGIRRLWDKGGRAGSGQADDATTVSDSFLDKSFQVRLQVPPPLLSDWKGFLHKLVESAMPSCGEMDRHDIYRVYDRCRADPSASPTPRQLKLYVNQIGVLYRQWQDSVRLSHLAYYAIKQREHDDLIDALSKGELPDDIGRSLLGEDLQASLAGLSFNVLPRRGMQLLLGDRVRQALSAANHEQLEQLAASHPDGFWPVFEAVVTTEIEDDETDTLLNAATCLQAASVLSGSAGIEAATVKSMLKDRAPKVVSWGEITPKSAAGIGAVVELFPEQAVAAHIASSLPKAWSKKAALAEADVWQTLDCLHIVFSSFRRASMQDSLEAGYRLPLDASEWIEHAKAVLDKDPDRGCIRYLQPQATFADISKLLVEAATAGNYSAKELSAVAATEECAYAKKDWSDLAEAIGGRLLAKNGATAEEAEPLLESLRDLKLFRCERAAAEITALADGHIHHHLAAADEGGRLAALCVYVLLDEQPDADAPTAVGNSAAGYAALQTALADESDGLASKLVSLVDEYGDHGFYFRVLDGRASKAPMVESCLRVIATGEEDTSLVFTVEALRQNTSSIRTILNGDDGGFQRLLGRLKSESSLCQRVMESGDPFSQTDALLCVWLRRAGPQDPAFNKWCVRGLDSLDRDSWAQDLKGSMAAIHLSVELDELGERLEPQSGFADALVEHAKRVAGGESLRDKALRPKWDAVLGLVGVSGTRKVFQESLLKVAVGHGGDTSEGFFVLYGDEISDPQLLNGNEQVVSELLSPLLNARHQRGLEWLLGVFKEDPSFLEKHPADHTVDDFQKRLGEQLSAAEDDAAQASINGIASLLGVVLPAERTEEEAETVEQSGSEEAD